MLTTKLLRIPLAAACLLLWGCGGGSSGGGGGGLTVELAGEPSVSWDAASGRTNVVVQFIARGKDGVPLAAEDVEVSLQVDGRPVDNEAMFRDSSEELAADLVYALVLDASYSMLQHNPSAFGPMKEAAKASVDAGRSRWTDRPGTFDWDVCWFNDHLFRREGAWQSDHIVEIPEPAQGAATKLYAAVEFMAVELLEEQQAGQAAGLRDRHVMVVLSDGADNKSWFDDSELVPTDHVTSSGANFTEFGWPATELADAVAAIEVHPNLTVHVLAMGSNFADEDLKDLRALASAGGGQFLRNPSSSGIAALFERVTKEFTTLQTQGAAIPQEPGKYTFTLVTRGVRVGGEAKLSFRYRAGPEAQFLR